VYNVPKRGIVEIRGRAKRKSRREKSQVEVPPVPAEIPDEDLVTEEGEKADDLSPEESEMVVEASTTAGETEEAEVEEEGEGEEKVAFESVEPSKATPVMSWKLVGMGAGLAAAIVGAIFVGRSFASRGPRASASGADSLLEDVEKVLNRSR